MTFGVQRILLLVALSVAVLKPFTATHGAPAESVFDVAAKAEEAAASKERNLQRNIADDRVNILYCTACGYQQNFNQIKTYLEDTFPHLVDRVYGANYEVDPYKTVGDILLQGVDMTMLRWARDNRIAAFFIVMFMGTAASSLTASGAFEIYFNDDLIFSKLETGRWPTLLVRLQLLDFVLYNAGVDVGSLVSL
ncbi:hypothetical protein AM587_10005789 [Phytophthora nicotianae]|uniref:Uncharacterized protein n=1 Tax=Phytophthora nicotianae TaxID=4792 RepID=A0A0W8CVY8_PHYNI|nr:hypothetical protein AM587_10005789 [Phytophthora nicotianae]